MDVDAVIEVLMGTDLSPEAAANSHTFSQQQSRQPQQPLPAPPGEPSERFQRITSQKKGRCVHQALKPFWWALSCCQKLQHAAVCLCC